MKTVKSEGNTSLPPTINWASKPKPFPAAVISDLSLDLVEESRSPTSPLVPVYINSDHIADLQEALRCLGESPVRQRKLELQVDSIIDDLGNIQKKFFIVDSPQSQQDAHVNLSMSDERDLETTFSRLSMSTPCPSYVTKTGPVTPNSRNAQSPQPISAAIRTAPATISGMSPQTSLRKRKYYVVLVGKCAGIYYDEWHVFLPFIFFSFPCLLTSKPSRENVEPLIRHVSNARYKGFSTHQTAFDFYIDAKEKNKVRIVRNPGDDEKYGPIENSIQ
jgi:hypothetical protein